MMRIIKCIHGKTVFQDCDECEKAWLIKRIADYENRIERRRVKLAEVEKRLNIKRLGET